ncbi:MAG: hypothetical protein K0U67_09835 [Actinomycetia bacterium]|nr:hypothetical protein [Actinomycetes bacterium]
MRLDRLSSRMAIVAAGAAIVAMGALTSCSSGSEQESAPTIPAAPASSAPAASPTEKALGPDYDGSFTPSVDPTPPSAVCEEVVDGVCKR